MMDGFIWLYVGGWASIVTVGTFISFIAMRAVKEREGKAINYKFLKAGTGLSLGLWALTALITSLYAQVPVA